MLSCLCDDGYKRTLAAKNSPSSGGIRFPLLLTEWFFTICPKPYSHKNVLSVSLTKTFPSFLSCFVWYIWCVYVRAHAHLYIVQIMLNLKDKISFILIAIESNKILFYVNELFVVIKTYRGIFINEERLFGFKQIHL